MNNLLSPARTIDNADRLKGRNKELRRIEQAFDTLGKHVMIYGPRGVGKTSLARTAVSNYTVDSLVEIFVSCDDKAGLETVINAIVQEINHISPLTKSQTDTIQFELDAKIGSFGAKREAEKNYDFSNLSIDQAARIIEVFKEHNIIIIVDEFDLISDEAKADIAIFTKAVSDRHSGCKFVLCGIGESADELFKSHKSAHRYFECVKIDPLKMQDSIDIVDDAAKNIGITVLDTYKYRIAMIADGFPHYVHDIAFRMFLGAYKAENGSVINAEIFANALLDSVESMDVTLKEPFEKATEKYDDYRYILFAAADGHELVRRKSSDIFESYVKIVSEKDLVPDKKEKFYQKINSLKKPSHGSILVGSRQGWYEFSDRVVRGYVRLRAITDGVSLRADDPSVPSTFKVIRL